MATLYEIAQQAQNKAIAANKSREMEIRGLYESNKKALQPGGSWETAMLADIERQGEKIVSSESQQMISSGLYGTTAAASIPGKVRREYTAPARLTLEDMLLQRRLQHNLDYAGFIERINNGYPDLGAVERGYQAEASVPSMSGTSPSTRPGWAIGYGEPEPLTRLPAARSGAYVGPTSRTPAVEAATPTRAATPSSSGDTLSRLYAEGRASWEETPLMQKKKKKTPTYNQLISQINPWL